MLYENVLLLQYTIMDSNIQLALVVQFLAAAMRHLITAAGAPYVSFPFVHSSKYMYFPFLIVNTD